MKDQRHGRLGRRVSAMIGAVAIGLLGSVALAAPASAAVSPNIDETKDGKSSITVHKQRQGDLTGDQGGDGNPVTGAPEGLSGVEFTLYKLSGIDLDSPEDWETLGDISGALAGGASPVFTAGPPATVAIAGVTGTPFSLSSVGTRATVDGSTTFSDLDFGIYLVVEGADTGNNNITTKAAPYLVSVPFAASDNTWLYAVHTYPKNSVTGIEKDVDDDTAYKLGDVVRWTVTVDIPNLPGSEQLESFVIRDTFDSRLGTLGVESVSINGAALQDADYEVGGSGQTVTVTPTLAQVNAAQGREIVVVFTSTVETIDATDQGTIDGVITNTAFVDIDGVDYESNEAETQWGALKIIKHAGSTHAQRLAGAEFALFVTEADAQAALDGTAPAPLWTGTTPTNGELVIEGLKAGTYYLVETQAPDGYTAHPTAITVTITAGSVANATVQPVSNTQVPPWELPLTGGNGALWFGVGGGALLAIAAGAALTVARRGNKVEA